MRTVSIVSAVAAALGLLVAIAATVAMSSLAGRAESVQLIKPHDPAMAELLGEAGTPVGSPQTIILADRSAVIEENGPDGATLVDEDKLKASGQYPLQLKTVTYVGGLAQMGGIAASLVFTALAVMLRRRLKSISLEAEPTVPSIQT